MRNKVVCLPAPIAWFSLLPLIRFTPFSSFYKFFFLFFFLLLLCRFCFMRSSLRSASFSNFKLVLHFKLRIRRVDLHFNTRLAIRIIHKYKYYYNTRLGHFSLTHLLSRSHYISLSFSLSYSATLLLVPLLGLQYMLTPFRPDAGHPWETTYQVISAFTASFQVSNSFALSLLTLSPSLHSPAAH